MAAGDIQYKHRTHFKGDLFKKKEGIIFKCASPCKLSYHTIKSLKFAGYKFCTIEFTDILAQNKVNFSVPNHWLFQILVMLEY